MQLRIRVVCKAGAACLGGSPPRSPRGRAGPAVSSTQIPTAAYAGTHSTARRARRRRSSHRQQWGSADALSNPGHGRRCSPSMSQCAQQVSGRYAHRRWRLQDLRLPAASHPCTACRPLAAGDGAGAAPAGLLCLSVLRVGLLVLVAVAGGPRARLRRRPLAGRARPHRRLRGFGGPVPAPRHRHVSAPPARLRCWQAWRIGQLAAAWPCARLFIRRVIAGGLRLQHAQGAAHWLRPPCTAPRTFATQHDLRAQRRSPSRCCCRCRPTAPRAPGCRWRRVCRPPCQRTSTAHARVCCPTRGGGKPGGSVCRLRPGPRLARMCGARAPSAGPGQHSVHAYHDAWVRPSHAQLRQRTWRPWGPACRHLRKYASATPWCPLHRAPGPERRQCGKRGAAHRHSAATHGLPEAPRDNPRGCLARQSAAGAPIAQRNG